MEDEFRYIKDSLCCVPFLIILTEDDTFVLQTDASGTGIGAVLSVKRDTGEKPVAFFSRKLLPQEQRYSATELEGLAVVDAITHFGIYLISSPFTVETDHMALSFLNTCKLTNGCLARWAMKLQSYTFDIKHRPGSGTRTRMGFPAKPGFHLNKFLPQMAFTNRRRGSVRQDP